MKKVLMISFVPTHPQSEGCSVRVYNLAKHLKSLNYDVHFLYVCENNREENIDEMKNFFGNENFHMYHNNRYKKVFNFKFITKRILREILKFIGLGKKIIIHYDCDEIYSKKLNKYIKQLDKKYTFDVAWVEYIWLSAALENFDSKVFKVIDTHDKFSNRELIYIKNNKVPAGRYTTQKGEGIALNRADLVIAIQDNEREFFESITNKNTKICTIGNMINITTPQVIDNKNYLFVGSNNDLNQFSIKYFIKNILPIVRQKEKDSKLIIVGGICNSLPDSDEYIKMGFVENIEEVYNNSRIVINPIKSGTGLNIKTIEAIGFSKPLITTSCGAKGLNSAFKICKVTDDDNEFANLIVELLNNDELALELSNNANSFAKNYNDEIMRNINKELKFLKEEQNEKSSCSNSNI